MSLCDNGIASKQIKCDQPQFYLDPESQMWLCFHCWWVDLWEDMQNDLINMGLNVPEDKRPKELKR